MADQKITELPIKGSSAINLADYLLGIDSAEGYQMLISDLAKKIIETYAGSSVAGSSQTLKAALDAINTKIGSETMGTQAATLTGAIAEHNGLISTQGGLITAQGTAIDALETLAGDTDISSIADGTLTGAVDELNSNLENIGDYKTASGESTVSIASGTTRSICSVTLDAGIWLITGQVAYQTGGNISGYRCAYLGTSSTGNQVANAQVPGTSANTSVIVAGLWSASQGQTIYLNALQGSGSALNVVGSSCKLKAVRIK